MLSEHPLTIQHDLGFEDHQVYTSEGKNTTHRTGTELGGRVPFNICSTKECLLSMYDVFSNALLHTEKHSHLGPND